MSSNKNAFASIPRNDSAHSRPPYGATARMDSLPNVAHNSTYALEVAGDEPSSSANLPLLKRERWKSRPTFIIASVGAAIGLGNVWRFPYLAFKHGGGAFLIPYVIFLFCTGLPLLVAELALGRFFQKGDVMAFGMIHKRARGVGAISCLGGFAIVTYYSTIIAWSLYFFGASFAWPLPWATEDCGYDNECQSDPDRALPLAASDAYLQNVVLKADRSNLSSGIAESISGPLYGTLLLTWAFSYLCIWKGIRSVGFAVRFTVVVPWILLVILIAYNATLEGSLDGVRAYIGNWDVSVLQNGQAWSDAAGQIFFSLGATLGIMSAYGSYAPMTTDVYTDSSIVAYLNCGTSIFCGFAVFSILGNMAFRQREIAGRNSDLRFAICRAAKAAMQGDPLAECDSGFDCSLCESGNWEQGGRCCGNFDVDSVASAGIQLAFSVYPSTMQYLGRGGANILSIMWFGTLFLLGIDSMFAMVEGLSTIITDTPRFAHVSKERVALWACLVGFMASVAFITDIGFYLLDAFDHYVLNYGLFVVGALEAYVIAWVWAWPETRHRCGLTSATIYNGGFTVASLVGCAIAGGLHGLVDTGANLGVGLALGVVIFGASVGLGFLARQDLGQPFRDWFGVMVWAGTRNLRNTFKYDPTQGETVLHIVTFDFMIKYVTPPAMLGLFINTAVGDSTVYSNGYGDYPDWVHVVVGLVVLGTMFGSLLLFAFAPAFWDRVSKENQTAHITRVNAGPSKDQDALRQEVNADHNPYVPQLPRERDGWAKEESLRE